MKLSEFLDTVRLTRMAQRTIDAARLVLVDEMRVIDAARQMGMKRQQVAEAVERIEAAYRRSRGVPDGWEYVTVCVPSEKAAEIRSVEREAKRIAGLIID